MRLPCTLGGEPPFSTQLTPSSPCPLPARPPARRNGEFRVWLSVEPWACSAKKINVTQLAEVCLQTWQLQRANGKRAVDRLELRACADAAPFSHSRPRPRTSRDKARQLRRGLGLASGRLSLLGRSLRLGISTEVTQICSAQSSPIQKSPPRASTSLGKTGSGRVSTIWSPHAFAEPLPSRLTSPLSSFLATALIWTPFSLEPSALFQLLTTHSTPPLSKRRPSFLHLDHHLRRSSRWFTLSCIALPQPSPNHLAHHRGQQRDRPLIGYPPDSHDARCGFAVAFHRIAVLAVKHTSTLLTIKLNLGLAASSARFSASGVSRSSFVLVTVADR